MIASWGHLNINVSDLPRSIEFYGRLGFTMMLENIPHLGLSMHRSVSLTDELCETYGLPTGTRARGCILQLDEGFPKLDLMAYEHPEPSGPPEAGGLGVERLCLGVRDLPAVVARLEGDGVPFVAGVAAGVHDLAKVAVCLDPDGTRIELIELDLGRFAELGHV